MRISDWSSDVCSSDLLADERAHVGWRLAHEPTDALHAVIIFGVIGRLGAGHGYEGRIGEPIRIEGGAKRAAAGADRLTLVPIMGLLSLAGLLLEIDDQVIRGADGIVAVGGGLVEVVAEIVGDRKSTRLN